MKVRIILFCSIRKHCKWLALADKNSTALSSCSFEQKLLWHVIRSISQSTSFDFIKYRICTSWSIVNYMHSNFQILLNPTKCSTFSTYISNKRKIIKSNRPDSSTWKTRFFPKKLFTHNWIVWVEFMKIKPNEKQDNSTTIFMDNLR